MPRRRRKAPPEWTVDDVRAIVTSPIYAGVGPFPALVDDDTWVKAIAVGIREEGKETILAQMRGALLDVGLSIPRFDKIAETDPEEIAVEALRLCRQVNPRREHI